MQPIWNEVTGHHEHRVTFSETDALGFVHHRCVAAWFEQSRESYFRRFGIPALELYLKGWYLAVRQLNVRYETFIAYEDVVSTRVALTKLGRVALDFHYRVDNLTTGKLCIRGHTNLVAVEAQGKAPPTLGRLRFDRKPFEKLVVSVDEFLDAPPGAWAPPRWDPD